LGELCSGITNFGGAHPLYSFQFFLGSSECFALVLPPNEWRHDLMLLQ